MLKFLDVRDTLTPSQVFRHPRFWIRQRSCPLLKDTSKPAERSGCSSRLLSVSRGPFKMQELGGREVKLRPLEVSTLRVSRPASLSISAGKGGPRSHRPEIYDFSLGGGVGLYFLAWTMVNRVMKKVWNWYPSACVRLILWFFLSLWVVYTHTLCAHMPAGKWDRAIV